MGVNLQKGQKVDLTKGNAGLKNLMIGLGWDAAQKSKGLFGGKTTKIDCDSSVFMLKNSKLVSKDDIIYFGHLQHSSGCVKHQGDNLTGDGNGDDEQIMVSLDKVPADYDKLVFVVNIYQAVSRKQHFGMINNAFIRITNADTGEELCRYNLTDNYDAMTAMIFGEVYKHNGEWKFTALGQGTKDEGLTQVSQRFS